MRSGFLLLAAVLGLAVSSGRSRACVRLVRDDRGSHAQDPQSALWSLLAPRASQAPLDEAALEKKIAALGTDVIRPLIAIYLGELQEPDHNYPVDPRAINGRPRIVLAALGRISRSEVLQGIDAAIQEASDVDRRIALARILGSLGGKSALKSILSIAADLDPIQWERTFVQVPLQQSLARVVCGQEKLAMEVAHRVRDSKPGLASILVRALVEADAWPAASELALAFGRDARLDLCLAEALAALGDKVAGSLPDSVLDALRSQLESRDPRLLSAAALALGRMGDAVCAPRLAQLMDEPDPVLHAGVRKALAALCGLDLDPNRAAWVVWIERERVWSVDRLPELERECLAGDPAVVPGAMAELVQHRLYRHRAARAVLPMLNSPNAAVVRLACGVLPGFGSRCVVPTLRVLARSADAEVRTAAASALLALTGEGEAPKVGLKPSDT